MSHTAKNMLPHLIAFFKKRKKPRILLIIIPTRFDTGTVLKGNNAKSINYRTDSRNQCCGSQSGNGSVSTRKDPKLSAGSGSEQFDSFHYKRYRQ
jgi:hypothetical protein